MAAFFHHLTPDKKVLLFGSSLPALFLGMREVLLALLLLVLMILIDMQRELWTFLLKRLIARLASCIAQSRELGRIKVLRSRIVSEKKGTRSIINVYFQMLFYPTIEIYD